MNMRKLCFSVIIIIFLSTTPALAKLSETNMYYEYDQNGNLTKITSIEKKSNRFFVHLDGTRQISLPSLAVNTSPGAKHTVEFWMYWDGRNDVIPFSWSTGYTLYFYDDFFGFNTGEGNIMGISATNLKNRWVHVAAVFYNGVPNPSDNEIYIDGVKQTISDVLRPTTRSRNVSSSAFISGWANSTKFLYSGKITDIRIWNYALSPSEIESNRYKVLTGKEAGLLGHWEIDDPENSYLSFDGLKQVQLSGLSLSPDMGAKSTVEMWMYWDGTNHIMPFGWNTGYSLYLSNGYFGFNTNQGNILGFSSANLANRWVHVAAVFYNGVPNPSDNEIYIDGVKQTISDVFNPTTASRSVTSTAFVSGWGQNTKYRFSGKIADVRIWNVALPPSQIQANMYKELNGDEPGLVGYWRLKGK